MPPFEGGAWWFVDDRVLVDTVFFDEPYQHKSLSLLFGQANELTYVLVTLKSVFLPERFLPAARWGMGVPPRSHRWVGPGELVGGCWCTSYPRVGAF